MLNTPLGVISVIALLKVTVLFLQPGEENWQMRGVDWKHWMQKGDKMRAICVGELHKRFLFCVSFHSNS